MFFYLPCFLFLVGSCGFSVMNVQFRFFLPAAMLKLNDLIQRDDFECVNEIDLFASTIEIKFSSKRCVIDKFGKVEWNDK